MSIVGMGWQEIMVIVIIAIIIFKPDNLPQMAGQAGKLLRDFRRMTQDMTGEFEKQTGVSVKDLKQNVDKEIAGLKSEMAGTTSSVQRELNSAKSTINKTATSVSKSANSAKKSKTGAAAKSATTAKTASSSKSASSLSTTKSAGSTTKTAKTAPVVAAKASKQDPLADVSFMENPGDASANGADTTQAKQTSSAATRAGAGNGSNGAGLPGDRTDALARARLRRQSAGYNQRPANSN